MTQSDLQVNTISSSLAGTNIDVIVSGSIAAVESVRFIRCLRRLEAQVTPWLSSGGANFITPMAVTWAADRDAITGFSGKASHIALSDAVVVAPASSSIIAKIARGMTDSHCTALVASALGQKKPVFILPAMHDSLRSAPAMKEYLEKISTWENVFILSSRLEEGKQKFPEPNVLADQISHLINQPKQPSNPVLITMGTTRGYIDDVRYISNYSSGKLGSVIAEELYRQGFKTNIICGPCEIKPQVFSALTPILTTGEMLAECKNAESSGLSGGIFCASVLDYEPTLRESGKIKSGTSKLSVSFHPTPKIIEQIKLSDMPKIGFKLEVGLSDSKAHDIADSYIAKYGLKSIIINELSAVDSVKHTATAYQAHGQTRKLDSKEAIAQYITAVFIETYSNKTAHTK